MSTGVPATSRSDGDCVEARFAASPRHQPRARTGKVSDSAPVELSESRPCGTEAHRRYHADVEPAGPPSDLESELRRHCEAGDYERAATRMIEGYGPELLGYLHAMSPSPTDADELFSELCERLWKALPGFRWQSSVRTWSYAIARNLLRFERRSARGPKGRLRGATDSVLSRVADEVRSTTPAHLRTEAKDRLRQIRDALEPDDRTLLILRVDRKLAWKEIAEVLSDDGHEVGTAALRKRFERLKTRLRREMETFEGDR